MPNELHVDARLRQVLPDQTPEQIADLTEQVLRDGITDPICYWWTGKRNVIVDGMTRFGIANEHGLKFATKQLEFEDYDAVELWMLQRQAGRRNLTPAQLSEIRGKWYNAEKDKSPAKRIDQTKIAKTQGNAPKCQIVTQGTQPDSGATATAEKIAAKTGVSGRTVKRDGKKQETIEKLPEKLRNPIKSQLQAAAQKDLDKLAKLNADQQGQVARELRTGQAANLKAALNGKSAPSAPKKVSPPKAFDKSGYYKQWDKSIGPLVRLVDKIASDVGQSQCVDHKAVQRHLNNATNAMAAWMGVEE